MSRERRRAQGTGEKRRKGDGEMGRWGDGEKRGLKDTKTPYLSIL
jgi:hypothetical protein